MLAGRELSGPPLPSCFTAFGFARFAGRQWFAPVSVDNRPSRLKPMYETGLAATPASALPSPSQKLRATNAAVLRSTTATVTCGSGGGQAPTPDGSMGPLSTGGAGSVAASPSEQA